MNKFSEALQKWIKVRSYKNQHALERIMRNTPYEQREQLLKDSAEEVHVIITVEHIESDTAFRLVIFKIDKNGRKSYPHGRDRPIPLSIPS